MNFFLDSCVQQDQDRAENENNSADGNMTYCEKRKKKYTFAATSSYSTILKKPLARFVPF